MPSEFEDMMRGALRRPLAASSDFDLHKDIDLPEGRVLRAASVLIAFRETLRGPELLLTKRSSALKHHPGQIAFPGGKLDEGDEDDWACALREAREEVGLPSDLVHRIGALAPHETVTGFHVVPSVAMIREDFEIVPEKGEVAEVFWVPASHIIRKEAFSVQSRRWRGRSRSFYTVPYGPYYIWGATARILRSLADVLA